MREKLLPVILVCVALLAACNREPRTLDELKTAGERAFVQGDFVSARRLLRKAVEIEPSNTQTLYRLGMSYSRDQLIDSAFYFLKRADLLGGENPEIALEMVRIAPLAKEWQTAIRAHQILINSGDEPVLHLGAMAEYAAQDSNFHSAYIYYRDALVRDPDNPNRYLPVATMAREIDSTDLAVRVLDSAIIRFGRRTELLANKAGFLSSVERHAEAETLYRELLARDTGFVALKLNLANSLTEQDSREKRREALELFRSIQGRVDQRFGLDTTIERLERELGNSGATSMPGKRSR